MSIATQPEVDLRAPPNVAAIVSGLTSLLLLVGLAISRGVSNQGFGEFCIVLFGFFGLGSAPLQFFRELRGYRFVIATLGLGVSLVILTGWSLIELNLWRFSAPLFIGYAVVATLCHLWGLFRNLPSLTIRTNNIIRRNFSVPHVLIFVTLLVGVSLSIGSAVTHQNFSPRLGGFPASIGLVWFLGLALIVLSILLSWHFSNRLVSWCVVAFVATVTVTPSIIYHLARYPWTQGQIGLTQFFLEHGSVNTKLNIYDSWPGFFSGIAWLCRAGGFSGVEQIARWWSPFADLTGAIIIVATAKIVGANNRNAWIAGLLFVIGDAVGQDYYSPQSVALIIFLLLIAVSLRPDDKTTLNSMQRRLDWMLVLLLSVAVAVAHPLTPFVVSGMLIILSIFGLLKSRLMCLAPLAFGTTWAALHHKVVSANFNFRDIGRLFANIQTPTVGLGYHFGVYAELGIIGQAVAAIAVGLLALVALLTLRDRIAIALAVCAGSAGLLVVLVHYGSESLFRATLFALPLLVLLASRIEWRTQLVRASIMTGLIPIIAVAYVFGDTAFDYVNVVHESDLNVLLEFYEAAPPGSRLIVVGSSGYFIESPIGREFSYTSWFYNLPRLKGGPNAEAANLTANVKASIVRSSELRKMNNNTYVFTYEGGSNVWVNGGVYTAKGYRRFTHTLVKSTDWKLISRSSTATLLKFRDLKVVGHRSTASG